MAEAVETPNIQLHNNIEQRIFIGHGNTKEEEEGVKRHLILKPDEATHMLILGPSGFWKTAFMRALIQELWHTTWGQHNEKPLILVFERKYDKSKAILVRETFYELLDKYSEAGLEKRLPNYKDFLVYIYLLEHSGQKILVGNEERTVRVGLMGDFALAWPNILGLKKRSKGNTLLGHFGLKPEAYPMRRIVFNPTRDLKDIALDSGPTAEVTTGYLRYKHLNYREVARFTTIPLSSIYGREIEERWDYRRMRDPDEVIRDAYIELIQKAGKDAKKSTYMGVKSVMTLLKRSKILIKNDDKRQDIFQIIDNDKINVIDFSQNSQLTEKEELLIFKKVIDYAIDEFARKRDTAVFVFVDEVQNYLRDKWGWYAVNKLFREGRSNQVALITATQYLHRLPHDLVYGATHIAIMGALASKTDFQILNNLIEDFDEKYEKIVARSPLELEKLKKKYRGRGYFSYNKFYTERIFFRPSQTL
ncbi:hypothetical protein VFC49_06970 [Thermococcus sp. SY098]|uniref:hypothetical protein n=1 Tax=Thermococcus sp. SY098 TaxID=3111325 RepID=UPI002D77B85C|nr:hypothetical protein [Thermococcus sp. SY098]WRS51827.1 hypothetical protein VFC49_06970 [Thermococcus sp. SY098]